MTDLINGQITDLLGDSLSDTETRCLGHAVRNGLRRALSICDGTMILASTDTMPSKILDALAVEMRSPYYLEDMPLQTKRESVRNSLTSTFNAGTKAAVRKLIEIVFGGGQVTEWFEGENLEPGTFYVTVESQLESSDIDEFNKIIGNVKNVRSHITGIEAVRPLTAPLYAACAFRVATKSTGVHT